MAFDSDDPEFVRGAEFGILWQRLASGESVVEQTVHATNTEMVMRLAEKFGLRFDAEDLGFGFLALRLYS